jgi:hypothetical protein
MLLLLLLDMVKKGGRIISPRKKAKFALKEEAKRNPFHSIIYWQGTVVDGKEKEKSDAFVKNMKEMSGARVQYATEIMFGDSHDLYFYVHDEDVLKFASFRLKMRLQGEHMLWLDDAIANGRVMNMVRAAIPTSRRE